LTHRPGHTLLVLGGAEARADDVKQLLAALEAAYADSPVVGAVFGLSTETVGGGIGRMDESAARQLGVKDSTLLAVRPDRYIGLRHDGRDPRVMDDYVQRLTQ
jgi:hypothetical protein